MFKKMVRGLVTILAIGIPAYALGVYVQAHQEVRSARGSTFVLNGVMYRFESDIMKVDDWWMGQFKEAK